MFFRAMRLFAPVIVLVFIAPLARAEGKKVALVVGVNTYNHAALNNPGPLQFAEADVKALADRLKGASYLVTTLVGKDATREAILKQLDTLRKQPGEGGVFLVAFAGHGLQPEADPEAYFCPFDADQRVIRAGDPNPKDPWDYKTLVPLTEVLANLKASTASMRVLLVDACRNDPASGRGRGVGTGLKLGEFPPDTAVLLACSRGQRAYEDKAWGDGHGAFLFHVLKGMEGAAKDTKGRVTARSLSEYVEDTVPIEVSKVIKGGAEQKPFSLISGNVDLGLTDPFAEDFNKYLAAGERYKYLLDTAPGRIAVWKAGAEQGSPAAQFLYAKCFDEGIGTPFPNHAEAAKWYRKAADAGLAIAMNNLGVRYLEGSGVLKKDDAEAVKWFQKAADAGEPYGMTNLGRMYAAGHGGLNKDDAEAVKWFRKGIAANSTAAMCSLGYMYAEGRGGLNKDEVDAVKWFRKAADAGNSDAKSNLGCMYAEGRGGLNKDDVEAVKWFKDSHTPAAYCNLGWMYEQGRGGLKKDEKEADESFDTAIGRGSQDRLYRFDWMYELGRGGLLKEEAGPAKRIRKSAETGDAKAMDKLGVLYERGWGGLKKDEVEAVKWYRKGAEAGGKDAMRNLGWMYEQGRGGLKKDAKEADEWYRKGNPNINIRS